MQKQQKLNKIVALKKYLRREYMTLQDRMKDDADWKEGINQFRLVTREELIQINRKLEKVIKKLYGSNKI